MSSSSTGAITAPANAGVSSITAVIPLKAVERAKTRMAAALTPMERLEVAHRTFELVVDAVNNSTLITDCVVMIGDDIVGSWVAEHNLTGWEAKSQNVNETIAAADERLGDTTTLVIPADLPLLKGEDIDRFVQTDVPIGETPGVVVVAPTADGGTGGLLRRPGNAIRPAYGSDSARRHMLAARTAGFGHVAVRIAGFAVDLERSSDLRHMKNQPLENAAIKGRIRRQR